jgi:hypothetical protein
VVTIKELPKIPDLTSLRIADLDEFTFLERVPIKLMFLAPYQRPIGSTQIGRMLRQGFDPRKLGIVTLSLREDGRYAIVDGSHRRYIAVQHGYNDMLARVFIDLTYEEEARLFEALNTIKAPTALDRFRARIEYEEETALDIAAALAEVQLRIGSGGAQSTREVSCVAALDRLYREQGPRSFREVLSVIHAAWGTDDPHAWSGRIIDGFRMFWARYRNAIEFKRLVVQMQNVSPRKLMAEAGVSPIRTDSPGALIGRQLVAIYMGRSRSDRWRLDPWTAHISTGPRKKEKTGVSRHVTDKLVSEDPIERESRPEPYEEGGV